MHCLCLQVAFGVIPWPRTNECLITLTFELMGTYWGYGYEFLSFDPVNTRYRKQNHHRVSFFTAHPLCNSSASVFSCSFPSAVIGQSSTLAVIAISKLFETQFQIICAQQL